MVLFKTDVGFSVVLKIQPTQNSMDVTVEGPLQHPSSALFFMFDKVFKSASYHSEDTHASFKSFLANDGAIHGNNNGNVHKEKLFFGAEKELLN
ncbi:hypothetical protein VNO77_32965 [Canavalia gladiata]|uniref:Uncharacterized protein n=1 Tax=Canavalia gladiata TaxID=3824 RepID=A0AAN9KDG5_CANGL